MRILYVACFGNHDNADEEAIAYALEQLGHSVTRVPELRRHRSIDDAAKLAFATCDEYDWCLFHKWSVVSEIAAVRVPRAFWFFDMVRSIDNDPTLKARSDVRQRWLASILPHCVAGFLTDGDAVAEDTSGKLHHLMQGADERVTGPGVPIPGYDGPEILFTGMRNHGRKRAEHIAELERRYGSRFGVLGDGGPAHRKHGRALADVFASTKIVIAPDGPNTDRYWSNRIFLTLGFGGFLLHPYCAGLESYYSPGELGMYLTRGHLTTEIDELLGKPTVRQVFADAGHRRTMLSHLYRHRAEELVRIVGDRL